jgi:hypothetical protein
LNKQFNKLRNRLYNAALFDILDTESVNESDDDDDDDDDDESNVIDETLPNPTKPRVKRRITASNKTKKQKKNPKTEDIGFGNLLIWFYKKITELYCNVDLVGQEVCKFFTADQYSTHEAGFYDGEVVEYKPA